MALDSYVNRKYITAYPVPPEGRIAIVTTRWRGLRWTLWRQRDASCADENAAAYGEIVWSWRRDPGATCGSLLPHNGGKKGRFPGESTYKP